MRRRYRAYRLPPGLAVDPQTGIVSGTPRQAGTFPSVIRYGTLLSWLRFRLGMWLR